MALAGSSVASEKDAKSNYNGDLSSFSNYKSGAGKVDCASMGDVNDKSKFR